MNNKHAIIIIKEGNKYLQYYDEVWESYLFPNCKIKEEEQNEIIKEIKKKYNIEITNLHLITNKVHKKLSQKDKIIKQYNHYFYKAELKSSINSNMKYFSLDELQNNKRIQEVNSDIVTFIKEIGE